MMPMIPGRAVNEVFIASLLLLVGTLLGNLAVAMLSLPIILFLFFAVSEGRTYSRIDRTGVTDMRVKVGAVVPIEHRMMINGPPGLIVIDDDLRDRFGSRSGRNIEVLWKERGSIELRHRYEISPLRQGRHEVGPTRLTYFDAYCLGEGQAQAPGDSLFVNAEARMHDLRKLRDRRSIMMLPMPVGQLSVLGAETTDFKEIREYRRGEAFRRVNWKASAKRQRDGGFKPFVNEYEREGKRKVWIFLDCGKHMEVGMHSERAMEHAGNIVRMVSDLYLAADCMVGLVLFNAEGSLLPDTGKRQKAMIARLLFDLENRASAVTMISMVRRLKGHLRGGNPLYLVITSVNGENVGSLSSDLKELKGIGGKRSKTIVLSIRAFELAARDDLERMAARFMALNQSIEVSRLRREGWSVVDWDPSEKSPINVVRNMAEVVL